MGERWVVWVVEICGVEEGMGGEERMGGEREVEGGGRGRFLWLWLV